MKGCGALGRHMAQCRRTGVPGEGASSLLLLGKRGCAPSGMGWLLSRQGRAQHKKAAILLDQLVSTEVRLCLHLFYFGCFISVGLKGTGVLTFLINS